jgi:hypothetical protein
MVLFGSDCLSLIQRIKIDRSSVGILVADIKHLVNGFSSASFSHVKQALNEAAHILAKSCGSVLNSRVFHSILDCIRETLCIDVV